MISKKMYELGSSRSVIREIFEFGIKRKAEVGAENVFDFSLGNPNVPAPDCVRDVLVQLLTEEQPTALHSYTSAAGDLQARQTIAESINTRFNTGFQARNLYMTSGAASAITFCFKALANPGDTFVTVAPYFPEYKCFVEAVGAELKVVPAQIADFQIDFAAFEAMIDDKTKAVIVNTPNNPSGVVYSEATILRLVEILNEKSKTFSHPIYLISDEPYREIVYDGVSVPYLTKYYKNTLVCYSYSKSLSIPGDRIGYVLIPDEVDDFDQVYAAVAGAARALGHVCASSLFQKLVARCADATSDIAIYEKNRDLLYQALIDMGYQCVKPEGAFYLFPQSLEPDAGAFCEKAKKYDLLLVPGDGFGCPGHVRISYCVTTEQIQKSLPAFQKLYNEYR